MKKLGFFLKYLFFLMNVPIKYLFLQANLIVALYNNK